MLLTLPSTCYNMFSIEMINPNTLPTWIMQFGLSLLGPSDWNRTSGLLNPILSPRLFVAENKEIIQLFRAFAIFRIVFISYFPYIPLAFRLYSTSVVGEERATMRPSLERSLLHPLSNRRAKSLLLVALLNRTLMSFRLFVVVDSN